MLSELCIRNLFLLDKVWINNFIWRCWEDYTIAYVKNVEQPWLVLLPWQCPCPLALSVQQFLAIKTTWGLSLILPPCDFFLFRHMKGQMKGKHLLMSAKCKRKCWRSWTTSPLKSSRNFYSSGKNIGASISSQKKSTLKETRVVIV